MRHEVSGLTRRERVLYCAGHFGFSLLAFLFSAWLQKFYVPGTGARTALITTGLFTLALAIGRLTDAVNDPLIGNWSDRLRSRWGRRKPLMAAALLPFLVTHILLWYPPVAHESPVNFWYLLGVQVVYFVAFTMYVAPYLALLPDIARTSADRASLATLQGAFNLAGLIAAGLLVALLQPRIGFHGVAWLSAGVAGVCLFLPLFGPRDREAPPQQAAPPLARSILSILSIGPFRIYLGSKILFYGGMMMMVSALPYLIQHRLHWQEGTAGYLSGVALLAGGAALPVVAWLVRRRGLKFAYLASIAWFAVSLPLLATLGHWGSDAANFAATYAIIALIGLSLGGLFACPYAIVANITDFDRARSGISRQALFFGVQGLVLKAAYAAGPGLALLVLFMGAGKSGTPQPLGLTLLGPVAGAVAALALLIFWRYPEKEVEAAVRAVHERPRPEGAAESPEMPQ